VEAAQRRRGFDKGVFGWLRHAPWDNPAFSGMALSLVLFGFLGGISGVVMGTEQLNLLFHNTLYVPGHFHGTVVAGTTLAFMALTYLAVPLIFRKELILKGVAKWQPYVFAIGVAGTSLFMMGAGTLGVSRRHWDISFGEATLSFDYPGTAQLMMGLNGIFGVIAAVGGAMYVVVVVGTLLVGKTRGPEEVKSNPIVFAGGEAATNYGNAGTLKLPGTMVLVGVFFLSFVLYYFINWKFLSEVWPLS
jgi:cytochrome c oxidase subunit 1